MQDYKLFVRTVWGGATVNQNGAVYIQNSDEATAYLRDMYLAEGYKILSVDYLGEVLVNELEASNSPKALRFAWHLVKDTK